MKNWPLTILLASAVAFSQNPAFDPVQSKGELYEYAEYTSTGKRNLDIDEIITDSLLVFEPLLSGNESVGFTTDYYWVRFRLFNSGTQAKDYYLETARPVTDLANLYQMGSQGVYWFKNGDRIPFKERQVSHRATVFKIELPPQLEQTFYLQLNSDGETINLPLELYDEDAFWKKNYAQQLFLGIFYGLLLLAGIIYLFFYSSLKEKAFLYYGIYVFSIAFMQASLDGLIFQYVFPGGGFLNDRIVLISALLSNIYFLKYCEHFLGTAKHAKILRYAYKTIYTIIGLMFLMLWTGETTLEWLYPLSNINGLLSLILIFTTIFVQRYKRIPVDPYFSFGIFFFVVGLMGFVLNNLSLLPNNFLTQNSAKFGAGLEVIFLSLSMTNLIRNLRLEKEISQATALRKSEEISELKSFFMSNMSHELRTPLNAIIGVVDEQLVTLNSSKNRKNYEIIKHASISLLSNINDILDFDKIDKNQLRLRQEIFNPEMAIRQISDNWKVQAELKGLVYKLDMDSKIPQMLEGDKERLMQIINNILSNAVKFTQNGHIHFQVECIPKPENRSLLKLTILDTGVGMNPEIRATMFDSFSQMRLNNKRNFGGIGLGLNIVNHLVNLFGGTIRLESEEGKGTVVLIEITMQLATKENEVARNMEVPLNILVVEDNVMNQMVMRKILGTRPFTAFSVANNGKEGITALQNMDYDLVLMDLQMPIMDGYEAISLIRGGTLGKGLETIPIIVVTADTTEETRERIVVLGANDYVTKPVNSILLLEKISKCTMVSMECSA